jgi:hypothetical protein
LGEFRIAEECFDYVLKFDLLYAEEQARFIWLGDNARYMQLGSINSQNSCPLLFCCVQDEVAKVEDASDGFASLSGNVVRAPCGTRYWYCCTSPTLPALILILMCLSCSLYCCTQVRACDILSRGLSPGGTGSAPGAAASAGGSQLPRRSVG